MEPYSSGEELLLKTRKPYTITKQRERWTEEEHNKFLEALKLYGRAWQCIEEHIGTKTTVQIRSHAQKFFTKLEKESFVKGVPIGHTLNINIPPPRPKRKPSNPYPRKTRVRVKDEKLSTPLSFLCQGQTALDLEQEPFSEKSSDDGNNRKHVDRDVENDSAVFSLHGTSAFVNSSSVNKNSSVSVAPIDLCTFREYLSLSTETSNKDETTQAFDAEQLQTNQTCNKELTKNDSSFNTSDIGNLYLSHEKYCHGNRIDGLQSKNIDDLPTENDDVSLNCLPHIPGNIFEESFGMNTQNVVLDAAPTDSRYQKMGVLKPPCLFMNPDGSTISEHHSNASSSSIHQTFPDFHPLSAAFQHQDDYQSFSHISSTFSSLLLSGLLQNPAAYAAASFAAASWPCVTMDTSGESSTNTPKGFQPKQMIPIPMATLVAATVAAATAWWAANGLLPFCPPHHPGLTSTAPSTTDTPIDGNTTADNGDKKEDIPDLALEGQQSGPKCSPEFQEQHSTLSSSCFEGIEGGKPICRLAMAETTPMAGTVDLLDSNKSNSRKQVDRSSCGSNTPSSSEVEAEGKEEKDVEDKESKEDEENHPSSDSIYRRCRSIGSINDPWKEVSEEGRLAFQALFTREILPQSFSHDLNCKRKKNIDMETIGQSQLNLNDRSRLDEKEEVSTMKVRLTGFKPYKRCSVEAKDTRMATNCKDEEKGPKRFRVGGIDKDST